MFAFLILMIRFNWFQNIFACFLPVGHTHTEDVDGMFGQIGSRKKFDSFHTPVWAEKSISLTTVGRIHFEVYSCCIQKKCSCSALARQSSYFGLEDLFNRSNRNFQQSHQMESFQNVQK